MEIHQLEYVVALDKYKSFSQAASEINVSQSTFSEQIKKLEAELKVKLFTRSTRRVQITPAGETFLHYAKRILLEVQKSVYSMHEYKDTLKGELRIGYLPYCTYLGITDIIGDFIKEHTGIDLTIYESTSDDLLNKLLGRKIDLTIISTPYRSNKSSSDINFFPIFEDDLVLYLAKSHHLSIRDQISLKELAQEKFILTKASSGYFTKIMEACNDQGFKPKIIIQTFYYETIKALVEKEIGITLIQSNTAKTMVNPNTTIVNLQEKISFITGLAVLENNHSLLVKAFMDFLFHRFNITSKCR